MRASGGSGGRSFFYPKTRQRLRGPAAAVTGVLTIRFFFEKKMGHLTTTSWMTIANSRAGASMTGESGTPGRHGAAPRRGPRGPPSERASGAARAGGRGAGVLGGCLRDTSSACAPSGWLSASPLIGCRAASRLWINEAGGGLAAWGRGAGRRLRGWGRPSGKSRCLKGNPRFLWAFEGGGLGGGGWKDCYFYLNRF